MVVAIILAKKLNLIFDSGTPRVVDENVSCVYPSTSMTLLTTEYDISSSTGSTLTVCSVLKSDQSLNNELQKRSVALIYPSRVYA